MTAPAMMVLPFQFAGWAYQPPAGDQTCLGYLLSSTRQGNVVVKGARSRHNLRDLSTTTLSLLAENTSRTSNWRTILANFFEWAFRKVGRSIACLLPSCEEDRRQLRVEVATQSAHVVMLPRPEKCSVISSPQEPRNLSHDCPKHGRRTFS